MPTTLPFRKLVCSGLLLAVALVLAGCSNYVEGRYFGRTTPPTENILRVGNGSEPRSFDPHKSILYPEGHVYLNVFEGLTSRDPRTLEPIAALATGWETRAAGRVWIFHLRRGAVFSDGTPITAHDFVWSWQRLVNPLNASPYLFAANAIVHAREISAGKRPPTDLGVRALDAYTLKVELEQPTPYFAKLVSAWAFVALPRRAIEYWGEHWTDLEHLVASGPFRVVEHIPYDQIVLAKNPRYWDRKNVQLDRIYLLPVTDTAQNANLYRAGELDIVRGGYLPPQLIRSLSRKADFQGGKYFASLFYSFNIKRKPFDDIRVRRALSLALNREDIALKYLGNGETPAVGIVPPLIQGYRSTSTTRYDPAEARRLLAEAGYPGGRGFPTVTLTLYTNTTIETLAQAVQSGWKEQLGIQVELQREELQTFETRVIRHDFTVTTDGWIGDYLDPTTFLDLFLDANPNNHSGWTDPGYTALMDRASQIADPVTRNRLLERAEALLVDRAGVIPLVHLALPYLKKPWVKEYHPNPLGQYQFKSVRIDRDWQRIVVAGRGGSW